MDNLFELEDGTVAVVDYESEYVKADKVKYLNYLTGMVNRYQKEKRKGKKNSRSSEPCSADPE